MNNPQPNIVLVLVDDLGWRDLGCYGSTFYETPNIDRLAAGGALFTDAYAASPVCSPSRASLLTGKYPARVGITQFIAGHCVGRLADVPYFPYLPLNEITLARTLRAAGYHTWHVGKWHLGRRSTWPERHGFDVNIGGCDWGHPPTYFSPYGCPTLDDGPDGEYLTDRLTDEAINLIESAQDRPFFLNMWHYTVHAPFEAPDELVEKYVRKAKQLGLDATDVCEEGELFPVWHKRNQHVVRRTVQSHSQYAAMIENLDRNTGRLLDALARTGKADNTIVIFTSDNGGLSTAEGSPTSNAPLAEGKGWTQEGGTRVPLMMRWPEQIAPGLEINAPTTTPDLYPTLLELAGLPAMPDQHVDGVSLVPALRREGFERGPIFWHYPHYSNQGGTPSSVIRDRDWKLIHFFEDARTELYNLAQDVSETTELSTAHPEITERMSGELHSWLSSVGASIPQPNPLPPFADLPG